MSCPCCSTSARRPPRSPRPTGSAEPRCSKVVLYGSYARGTWVDEPHAVRSYRSDYDLLVIVNHDKLTDHVAFWSGAEDRLNRELATGVLTTPANIIVHSLNGVTDGLAQGRYFFADIARDGIMLHQTDTTDLPEPQPLTSADQLALAREYMDEWWPSANEFYDDFRSNLERGRRKKAAFELHQAAERFYHCVLLVCTSYTLLCRARHKSDYAERRTMPSGLGFPARVRALAAIGAA